MKLMWYKININAMPDTLKKPELMLLSYFNGHIITSNSTINAIL